MTTLVEEVQAQWWRVIDVHGTASTAGCSKLAKCGKVMHNHCCGCIYEYTQTKS